LINSPTNCARGAKTPKRLNIFYLLNPSSTVKDGVKKASTPLANTTSNSMIQQLKAFSVHLDSSGGRIEMYYAAG
jgi:hypothetical protein